MVREKKEKEVVEFDEAVHGEELRKLIKDSSDNLLKAEGFKAIVKDNALAAKKLGVEPKKFNKLVSMYHKGTRERFEDESAEMVELYDSIIAK